MWVRWGWLRPRMPLKLIPPPKALSNRLLSHCSKTALGWGLSGCVWRGGGERGHYAIFRPSVAVPRKAGKFRVRSPLRFCVGNFVLQTGCKLWHRNAKGVCGFSDVLYIPLSGGGWRVHHCHVCVHISVK